MAKHGDEWVSKCGLMTLRCGDYREVLADVQCDAVITDPPYSAKTHSGQRHGRVDGSDYEGYWVSRRGIGYDAFTREDTDRMVGSVANGGWWVVMTDSELQADWRASMRQAGLTVFQPLPVLIPGMNVRLAGDGPSSWCIWVAVGRPKSLHKWGTLPGGYYGKQFDSGQNSVKAHQSKGGFGGGYKPRWIMQALVRDYSREGDLVCDPCAGTGTTLLAAAMEGRRAIGAEIDPDTFELAVRRLSNGYTPDLFAGVQP